MPVSDDFLDFLIEQLAPVTPVSARRMFGGAGLYADGRMFALIADDRLYIKVDAVNRAAFEAEGLGPFLFRSKDGKEAPMNYYEAPEAALDDPDVLADWCRLGMDAALRQPAAKRKSRKGQ